MPDTPEDIDVEQVWNVYLDSWRVALSELLGWSPAKTDHWVSTCGPPKPEATDASDAGCFFHEPPVFYLLSLFLPPREQLKAHGYIWPQFVDEFVRAIEAKRGLSVYHDASYDWSEARHRIDRLLRRVGTSLEEVRRAMVQE